MEPVPSNTILGDLANFNQYEYQENNEKLSALKFQSILQTQNPQFLDNESRNQTQQKENVDGNEQTSQVKTLMTTELDIGKHMEASRKKHQLTSLLKGDRI